MRLPEVLAPAGGQEQLLAAVRCGADAVYLGSKGFNARRNAENFDEAGLPGAVRYCHGRGVAVHVALNTLVTDAERDRLVEEIRQIAHSGADAVIVQDLGVAALVRQCCPTLAMHASTQLSVHSVAGAELMRSLGFTRLVLARELSAKEIAEIKGCGLEIEIFVHGALCMSMSGSCYMSALLGERSGNRGVCAQPCRLNFDADGREYALSLKDLSLIPRMRELTALGVDSLKIEGRMKRPEYVAAAVTACRQALAGEQPDMERLQAVFSRGGFTDGYFTGKRATDMFGYRRKEDVTAAAGVLGELAGLYRGESPRVPVEMEFKAVHDSGIELTVSDGEHSVTVSGEPPQRAINRPTDCELVRRGLEKLGGTPFYLDRLNATLDEGVMVPVSAINTLRKSAAELLLAERELTLPHAFTAPQTSREQVEWIGGSAPRRVIRLETPVQLTALAKSFADLIILPLDVVYSRMELIDELGDRLAAELPMFIFPEREEQTAQRLTALAGRGLRTVVAGTQGPLELARRAGLCVMGDYSLNILNSVALGEYERLGLSSATLSYEISMKAARQLEGRVPVGVLGYGYLPVMTYRNCPARGEKGCGGCDGKATLTDRKGVLNTLLCRDRQYTQLLNSVPLYLGDRQEVLKGLGFVTLYFTVEDAAETDRVLGLWAASQSYPAPRTGGLYFRELL